MGIELIEHTADVRLRVTARTVEELFREALRGTMGLLHPERGKRAVHREIAVEAADSTSLLVDFLNEALSSAHANREAYDDVAFASLTETRALARLTGTDALAFAEDVKAVTYHEADIRRDSDRNWSTTLVFDI